MCSNYTPGRREKNEEHFGVHFDVMDDRPNRIFAGAFAPIIIAEREHAGMEVVPACFGIVPHWADMKLAKSTYNARAETVDSKPSFRHAWKQKQFCIVPAESFYEPCYETGKSVWWEVRHAQDRPMGIAGIWEWKADGVDGKPMFSFSMITINADGHAVMTRFHKPGDEKRMIVILKPDQYQTWLAGGLVQTPAQFQQYPADQLIAKPLSPPPAKQMEFAA
ncbi:MAG: SOS response-associated peptidase family protein [Burkholderiales bacterium]|nr:SOS response-associated peptidase family protein [Burkholderiales bacterium]